MERLGIVDDIRAERAALLANVSPAHRARLLGRRPAYAEPKVHAITVDLKTGKRTVEPVAMLAQPKPEPRPPVVRRIIVEYPSRPHSAGPSPETIVTAILAATEISLYEFLRQGRCNDKITRARQMGYWLTKKLRPDMSLGELGRMFRKDHTTCLAGARRGEELKDTAPICDWLAHPAIVALLEEGRRS